MKFLNKICSYWYECIKNEDILEGGISINSRTKAVLYPFDKDGIVFNRQNSSIKINDERINNFSKTTTENQEYFYGYPLLYYKDDYAKKELVAPLFVIKVKFVSVEEGLFMEKDERCPTCGVQAFKQLGLRIEEISNINQSIQKVFKDNSVDDGKKLCDKVLEIIKGEIELNIREEIDPSKLSNSVKITEVMQEGLYNKSILFSEEPTVFNIHLIKDLLELKDKNDLETTSLSFFSNKITRDEDKEVIPILPFQSNEYQVAAIKDIFKNSLSVITGPPGTGKSQFISNLIVNLFLMGKSVLFVSHTGEAVDVVNSKINEAFNNLMLRTGKKELRQDLKGRFNELIANYSKNSVETIKLEYIHSLWKAMLDYKSKLAVRSGLESIFELVFFNKKESFNIAKIQSSFFVKIGIYIKIIFLNIKLYIIKSKLKSLPNKMEVELKIKEIEKEYYTSCQKFVSNIYLKKIFNSKKKIGSVNNFLNQVNNTRSNSEDIEEGLLLDAMGVLKIWSSTLKSLRATFPLKPGIFDCVIFDEASQIDLPSAAVALYRAKRAIIVGDPMQLAHIAGISEETDQRIAEKYNLNDFKDIYPSKVRYYDVSLYRSAENYLSHLPTLLINHYRSEDQIISLCNNVFYNGTLKIMSSLDRNKFPSSLPLGIQWEDVANGITKRDYKSRINTQEVDRVIHIFKEVIASISNTDLTVGIVTPYSGQRRLLNKRINDLVAEDIIEKHKLKILTAHQFQGSEKDIVIFSLVAASDNNDSWYNSYQQILNVALSRARYLLYIVGNKNYCNGRQGILKRIAETYDKIKKEEKLENYDFHAKFDSSTERSFYEELQKIDIESLGYKLIPKLVVKRYTLDFAIVGKKKIDIEIDGTQHNIIDGLPVLEDVERDKFLREEGWIVMRFPNHMILSQPWRAVEKILEELKK